MVLWVPSWRGEECRVVWEAGSASFFLSIAGSLEGPTVTAAALSLGLLRVEWHSKLMGKCLRLTFLCTCVTGARWPADCLCQRLTGPLLQWRRETSPSLFLQGFLMHPRRTNWLWGALLEKLKANVQGLFCFAIPNLTWADILWAMKSLVALDLGKGDGVGTDSNSSLRNVSDFSDGAAWAEKSRCG